MHWFDTFLFIDLRQYRQRFVFFLVFALFVHGFIIFAISFHLPQSRPNPAPMLDIVLSPLEQTPDKVRQADYLAQTAHRGGKQKNQTNTTPTNSIKTVAHLKPRTQKPLITPVGNIKPQPAPQPSVQKQETKPQYSRSQLSTHKKSSHKVLVLQKKTQPKIHQPRPQPRQVIHHKKTPKKLNLDYINSLKQQIVDLEADIRTKSQLYARHGNYKYVNASTARAVDAEYIHQWTKKIERIGNLNYPAEARKKGLYGKLILAVTLSPQGQIKNIRLVKSSGIPILDKAAIRIVRLASPYAPIPKKVLQGNHALVITRTWLFSRQQSGGFSMD